MLGFLDLDASFSRLGCLAFEIWVLRGSVFVFDTTPGVCRGILKTRGTRRNKETPRNHKPTKFTMVKKETVIIL